VHAGGRAEQPVVASPMEGALHGSKGMGSEWTQAQAVDAHPEAAEETAAMGEAPKVE